MSLNQKQGGPMGRLLFIMLFFISACNGGAGEDFLNPKTDPFADYGKEVKDAVPPGTDQTGEAPILGAAFLDADPYYEVREGDELIIPLEYRLTHPEITFVDLRIPNLEKSLPGATFDETTNEVQFTAGPEYIPAGELSYNRKFKVELLYDYKGLIKIASFPITVNVIRSSSEPPVIEDVVSLDGPFEEGIIKRFTIMVRDTSSPSGPTLNMMEALGGAKFAGPYIEIDDKPDDEGGGLWKFDAMLRLDRQLDVVKGVKDFSTLFVANSVFGVRSKPYVRTFTIYSKADRPYFFVDRKFSFVEGEKQNLTFSVVDLRREGEVEAKFDSACAELGGDAQCSCEQVKMGPVEFQAQCNLQWTPIAGSYRLDMSATNTVNSKFVNYSNSQTSSATILIDVAPVTGTGGN